MYLLDCLSWSNEYKYKDIDVSFSVANTRMITQQIFRVGSIIDSGASCAAQMFVTQPGCAQPAQLWSVGRQRLIGLRTGRYLGCTNTPGCRLDRDARPGLHPPVSSQPSILFYYFLRCMHCYIAQIIFIWVSSVLPWPPTPQYCCTVHQVLLQTRCKIVSERRMNFLLISHLIQLKYSLPTT